MTSTCARPKHGGWARSLLSILVGALMLIAALSKAWNTSQFAWVLVYTMPWLKTDVGQLALVALAVTIIALEAFLGGLFLFGAMPGQQVGGRMHALLAAMLLVFTVFLVVLALDPAAPGCGCLGLLLQKQSDAQTGIVRNVALLWVVAWLARNQPTLADES